MRRLLLWGSTLVLPLALLLFLQWPLRDLVHAYARQANDLGQILFAVYVAVAVSAASRAGTHLVAGTAAHGSDGPGERSPRWRGWAVAVCVAPFALFTLWASWGPTLQSIVGLERFAETNTPGYFLIKLALCVLLLLLAWDAAAHVCRAYRNGDSR